LYDRDAELDVDYYLNTHMPLVQKLLGPSVLISWKLWKLPDNSPFSYEGEVIWASIEAREAALKTKEGSQCKEDLKNFVKKPAMVFLRELVGSGPNS
jgi:uncharacterized protein (TIGR02118 family)